MKSIKDIFSFFKKQGKSCLLKQHFTFFIIGLFCSCTNMTKTHDESIVEALIDSLNYHRETQDGEKILFYVDTLKTLGVNMPNVALEYAVAYAYMGNFDKGIQILKDSIGTSTKPQLLYNELGSICLAKGDTASAIIAYKQALECNPNYARPYINLAELYKCKKEKELAINHYFEAIKLFAQYEYYEEMGNFATEILNIDSTNIEANKFLQYYYYKEKDYKTALAIGLEIDKLCVVQNRLKDGYANMYFMGMILFEMGEYEKSISLMHQASEDDETVNEYGYSICCYVSASYRKLGDNENADYFLELAKKINTKAEEYINSLLVK